MSLETVKNRLNVAENRLPELKEALTYSLITKREG
jgi:hypothetical protein